MKRILIVCNVDWFVISHRLGIIKRAVNDGYEVIVAAENTGRANEIEECGARFINLPFSRSGTNPIEELKVLFRFNSLYNEIKPDIVHHITIKPVIYGSIIAKKQKIRGVVNAIAGLGYNFTSENKGLFFKFLLKLMKYGFNRKKVSVIFQNTTDYEDLRNTGVLSSGNNVYYTKGSGVDLEQYKFSELPNKERIKVLFPTRMLWEKGVKELKEATNILKDKYEHKVSFILAGLADDGNKSGVTADYLNEWSDGEYVKWVGFQSDMPKIFEMSDIVTLPSYYREGIPKSLIEACAMGRPIISTDSVGCRECVEDGYNGYKIAPRNSKDLAIALEKMFESQDLRKTFGFNSRIKAEKEFNVETVIDIHMGIYKELLNE
ncbi:Glycosyltransferase involved in cell wall bisynthesis [Myroides marinus]|uniref:Glycosyltransferase involved in cell wall bisynthesis n=1 Tax=Myroides marinus TaxID=703342 RepID=A0A1H6XNR7_9FLAO|nr:glycosyltransferase family 4 protein [Myroides marinus]SEJ29214.1 Glycosyltransferase involved in cell wall bisynthesis [Myroides marinus]